MDDPLFFARESTILDGGGGEFPDAIGDGWKSKLVLWSGASVKVERQ
jgi:hypothetical protein